MNNSVDPSQVETLFDAKKGIHKIFNYLNKVENNQREKIEYARLVNPGYKIAGVEESEEEEEEDVEMSEPEVQPAVAAAAVEVKEKKFDLRKSNDLLMRLVIVRYFERLLKKSKSLKQYKKGVKKFEETRFVLPYYKRFYHDCKVHFLQKAFAKEIAGKIVGYGQSVQEGESC